MYTYHIEPVCEFYSQTDEHAMIVFVFLLLTTGDKGPNNPVILFGWFGCLSILIKIADKMVDPVGGGGESRLYYLCQYSITWLPKGRRHN